jgi:hypothetical protein
MGAAVAICSAFRKLPHGAPARTARLSLYADADTAPCGNTSCLLSNLPVGYALGIPSRARDGLDQSLERDIE